MSLKSLVGEVQCLFGFHDWGESQVYSVITASGERTEGGWETDVSDSERVVKQRCRRRLCGRLKERPNLDPDDPEVSR